MMKAKQANAEYVSDLDYVLEFLMSAVTFVGVIKKCADAVWNIRDAIDFDNWRQSLPLGANVLLALGLAVIGGLWLHAGHEDYLRVQRKEGKQNA